MNCLPRLRLLLLLTALVLSACDRKPQASTPEEKVTVVGTVYPLADVARQVGGAYVDVSWIVESGQTVFQNDPPSEARSRLRTANLVFMSGSTEPWAFEGIGNAFQQGRIVRLDSQELRTSEMSDLGFLWLDPLRVQAGTRELCGRLQVLRPKHSGEFQSQADLLSSKLDAIVKEYQQKLADAITRKVLVLSPDFNALLRRFSLIPVQPVTTLPTRLSDADVLLIKREADQNKTRLLLIPSDTPAAVVRDIESRASVHVVLIDCLGSSAAGGRNSYLDLIHYNLEQLLHATTVQ